MIKLVVVGLGCLESDHCLGLVSILRAILVEQLLICIDGGDRIDDYSRKAMNNRAH